ncbi:MAG: CinA family protein [Candidatus Hodarchaeales archaeon]
MTKGGSLVGEGYYLLHQYAQENVIPLIVTKGVTVSTVELTVCGLVSDLLTGKEGASAFFILGITPYSAKMKTKLSIPPDLLIHDGPGTVSFQSARALAQKIRHYSESDIGIAETGMLPTNFQGHRTRKRAGEVYLAIDTARNNFSTKLKVDPNHSRLLMRQEIAWKILVNLEKFLDANEWPKQKTL